jgi:uncharacterized protein (DUF4415 family)
MRKNYDFSKAKRGAAISTSQKTRITIMLDDDVLDFFRSTGERQGTGYQTLINQALRQAMSHQRDSRKASTPLTVAELRRVLREELKTG